jgi:hypothetical protein
MTKKDFEILFNLVTIRGLPGSDTDISIVP